MRELKFRAWDNDTEKFFDGRWCIGDDGSFYDMTSVEPADWCIEKNFVVEQYTGVKDKNGKEIYEGDIIKYKPYEDQLKYSFPDNRVIGKVYWSNKNACFFVHNTPLFGGYWNHCEVIGNIHENPELLEGEDEN